MRLRFRSLLSRKAVRIIAAAFLLFVLLPVAAWFVAPYCVEDPMIALKKV